MPFEGAVRSRLASRLRPWLREEPDVELKLGFLKSNGSWKNLVFDTSALNALIGESTRLVFKRVRVEDLRIRFSPWSNLALSVDVRGVDVILAPREPMEESHPMMLDSAEREMKEALASIDPEGAILHDILKGILETASSSSRLTIALTNAVLRRCRLRFQDICFRLQFKEELYACLLRAKELVVEPQLLGHSCLFRGLATGFFVTDKESSLAISCSRLEFGLKENDHVKCIMSSRDSFVCIRLDKLKPTGFDFHFPLVDSGFSPLVIPVLVLISDVLSRKEVKCVRNGRELWKTAALRIGHLSLHPRVSLHKLVNVVVLWLRYLHAYESLLLLVGYSDENIFKQFVGRMSSDRECMSRVQHQLKVVDEMEKRLPPEAVVRARWIARQRALLCSQGGVSESPVGLYIFLMGKIFALHTFLCKFIYFIFHSVARVLLIMQSVLNIFRRIDTASSPLSGIHSRESGSQHHLNLFVGALHISLSPVTVAGAAVNRETGPDTDLPHLNLLSFSLEIKSFCLSRTADRTAQSMFLVVGELQVHSSSLSRVPLMETDWEFENTPSFKTPGIEIGNDSEVILWSEPAPSFHPSKRVVDSANSIDDWVMILENCLGEMWSAWKAISEKFEASNQQVGHPFIICELENFFMNPYLSRSDCGLCKCSISLGKLNFELEYSSIMSVSVLFSQIHHSLHWTASIGKPQVLANSNSIIEGKNEINLEDQLEFYAFGVKMTMLNMMPERNILVAAVIGGPNIQLSLRGGRCFSVDLENIELAVWPASRAIYLALTQKLGLNEAVHECFWLKEPRVVDIPKTQLNEIYISQRRITHNAYLSFNGLTAFFGNKEDNQKSHVIGPMSMTIQSSTCRYFIHSFYSTMNACSVALSGIATGANVLSYMDDLWTLFQVFEGVLSVAPLTSINFDSAVAFYSQEHIRKFTSTKKDIIKKKTTIQVEDKILFLKSTQFIIDADLEFKSVDIILNNSRKKHYTRMKSDGALRSTASFRNVMVLDLPDQGIGIFFRKSCIQFSWKGGPVEVLIDLSGIQSVIFKHQSELGICTDVLRIKNLLHQCSDQLYEFYLSSCIFSLSAGFHGDSLPSASINTAVNGLTSSNRTHSVAAVEPHLTIIGEGSEIQSHGANQGLPAVSIPIPGSSCWVLTNIELGEIFVRDCYTKNLPTEPHRPCRLQLLISIIGGLHTINCEIQGGYVFLETSTLAMFIQCFKAYSMCLSSLPSWLHNSSGKQSGIAGTLTVLDEFVARPSNHHGEENVQATVTPGYLSETCYWRFLEVLNINISHFSLAFAVTDGSGGAQKLTLEADINLKLTNLGRKLSFDLSRLTILSQHLHKPSLDQRRISPIPHFHSSICNDLSSYTRRELPSGDSVPEKEISVESGISGFSPSINPSCILKHLAASIVVERTLLRRELDSWQLKSDWVGNGFISGFDLTITLSQIQMLSAIFALLSGTSSVKAAHSLEQNFGSGNEGWINDSNYRIPDGAIVAIQDLHQHLYFAVEAVGMKYHLLGTLHYSLVGERALFRVRYFKPKRWRSQVSWFSLTSLHAKNDMGEPLRLNFCPGSGFVEISSSDDKGWALWQIFPYKPDRYGDGDNMESYMISARKAFHLVNQKNNCGIAFVDGLPEFVRKPGNPFKVKVFHELTLTHDVGGLNVPSPFIDNTCESNIRRDSSFVDREKSGDASNLSHVNITIDRITFTILHEFSDANDKFPLTRCYIDNVHIIGQILPSKFRLISTYSIGVDYFDAQRNFWKEIISPVDACIFFHSRFTLKGSEHVQQGLPVHFYFRMRQVDIYLTELSLDILLLLAGKLNVAGPYAVRSSMFFANCCKVENLSGINLLCHFSDNQDAIIAGRQSTSIFLRQIPLADHLPENESSVSVRLSEVGGFSTSPLHISLSNARVVAWRTRIASQQDSRTLPGPFIVVEVSKKTEDGLSLVVSPLLRIHNESGFSMELRFRRPQETEVESASVLLRSGDIIDDSRAVFDALDYSGGLKKALMSLSVGNFLLSFRPDISECFGKTEKPVSIDWSEDLRGGKAVPVSGIFDKLNYKFRKAFGVASVKSFFSTIHCPLIVEGLHVSDMHFLIQTIGRDVPVMQPPNVGSTSEPKASPVAFQVQKEIFISPTVQVSNLLQTEIHVVLTENHPDLCTNKGFDNIGKHATIPCGSSACLYANPAIIYFTVSLSAFSSKCKPVNSSECVKKLHKQKNEAHYFDIDLDFGGGKYFASLRLSRGDKGILEAIVFTSYTLQNNTELSLFCFVSNQKPLSRAEVERYSSSFPPELGAFLPPKSTRSWFLKSNRVHLKQLEEKASEALLDLDILSGFTELSLESQSEAGVNHIAKVGVSLKPCTCKVFVPAQVVSIVPRYVISNESKEPVIVRQCYLENDIDGITHVEGKQKAVLYMQANTSKKRETSFFNSMLGKHRNVNEDYLVFIQFCLKEIECSWSGPICIASLGRFFIKFKREPVSFSNRSHAVTGSKNKVTQFAAVHILEEGSSLVLHFHMPPNLTLPYRIENCLRDASITYYQKDLVEPEILGSGNSVEYVWDDLNLPHKLVVQISGMHILREINIDKVCAWKPFFKTRQNKRLMVHLPLNKMSGVQRRIYDESHGFEMLNLGYEVYADGLTRVLRICEFVDSYKEEKILQPRASFQFRVSYFAINLLENGKQDEDELPISKIIVARLGNITLDSMTVDQSTYNCVRIQSINVDEKWQGAPFASMVRRSQLHDSFLNEDMFHFVFILHSNNSNVKQVTHCSIVLQPVDLNLDEETLMRLATFWRTSLNDSKARSQLFYFKHFEIHPIKIKASFLPGNPYSSYSSAQETLRSFLHSVIKVPAIKNTVVELNGVLLTHALVTKRELLIKCAQHYSWYIIRAVYIAKGSLLLPPAFASIFDDAASSSLDVFFDPSDGSINLPGLTLGMFKFISKCIDSKGFSGTKRYFGDLGKTMKKAGSNALFAAITEISDSILKGAESNGFNGLVNGFHQGILRLAMEPSLLGAAVMEGGPDRKIKLDRTPGVDELYIEGYLQAMLDVMYKQEYLRVRVIDNLVVLKNLPPNSSLINEIVENVKSFLVSKALLKGETPTASRPLRHLRGESEWRIGPTVLTLCEHLFVSFTIRILRKQADKLMIGIRLSRKIEGGDTGEASLPASSKGSQEKPNRMWAVGKFVLSGILAYVDGRLCRHIPNPIARRIVSGFLLSFLDKKTGE